MKQKVLFLCKNNSARSQMAEGFLRTYYHDKYEAFSAGVNKTSVNAYAFEVMKEIGIDLPKHYSKNIDEFQGIDFDYVATVCDEIKEMCPFFPGKKVLHKSFQDPASFNGDVEQTLAVFRKVRDELKVWIIKTFDEKTKTRGSDE